MGLFLKRWLKRNKGPVAQFIAFVASAVTVGEIYYHFNLELIPTIALLTLEAIYINLSNWIYENWY